MKNRVLYSFNKYTSDDYKACLSEIGDNYEWEIAEDQTTDAWALSLPEITQEIVDRYHLVDFRCVKCNDSGHGRQRPRMRRLLTYKDQ